MNKQILTSINRIANRQIFSKHSAVNSLQQTKFTSRHIHHQFKRGYVNTQGNPNGWKIEWFYIPAGVGFGVIALIQIRHIWRRKQQQNIVVEIPYEDKAAAFVFKQWQVDLLRKLPTRVLSRAWGYMADCHLPVWMRKPLINSYSYMFDCNLGEAMQSDVTKYETFNKFFSRKLKPGMRLADKKAAVVSPADSSVLTFGTMNTPTFEIGQVKGLTYPLSTFVGSRHPFNKNVTSAFSGKKQIFSPGTCTVDEDEYKLCYCTLYLAPGDYHWFHSPTEWTIEHRRHIPGDLFSVNPRALKSINGIFNFNERVLLSGHWEHGPFLYAAVGAYNVGSIKLDIPMDRDLQTNKSGSIGPHKDRLYSTGYLSKRGDSVGNFLLGSSIVLIFSAPKNFQFAVEPGQKVQYGQALGYIVEEKVAGG